MIACGDVMMMTCPESPTEMANAVVWATFAVAAYTRAVKILKKGIDIARTREIEARLNKATH